MRSYVGVDLSGMFENDIVDGLCSINNMDWSPAVSAGYKLMLKGEAATVAGIQNRLESGV